MSISIDPQEGGPIEGLFGGQVEQRIGHLVEHGDEPSRARRTSESEGRLLGAQRSVSAPPLSPRPGSSKGNWIPGLSWIPWKRGRSSSSSNPYRSQINNNNYRRGSSWWGSGLYNKISFGILPMTSNTATSATAASKPGVIRYIRINMSALVAFAAGLVSTKRRKSWFLSLILVSLVLTLLSGGYLLSQFQHQQDNIPPAVSVPGSDGGNLLVDPGTSGPRRDRNRGKKHKAPKKQPTGQTRKNETIPAGGQKIVPNSPGSGTGTADDTNVATGTIICNLEDVADGQWVHSEAQSQSPEWGPNQDMSWTGYGHNSCRSNIWNERYLLTPTVTNDTTSKHRSTSTLQRDWDYAYHLKNSLWQPAQKQRQGQEGGCKQPEMDVEDFVEVLKRAPLVMIGDKFLEQEYLTIECLILGMQDQLVYDYQLENNKNSVDEKTMKGALDYWIESETPPVVEFKVAPQFVAKTEGTSSTGKNRPAVYRKAKPGQMRLVDRASNLTLVTFIRSDVLWDSEMLTRQTTKHTLKSIPQPSNLDAAGGLHPDCKLAGTVLLCEPARIDFVHDRGLEGYKSTKQSTTKHWWQWWIGADGNTETEQLQNEDIDGKDVEDSEENMSFGSDFDHDMINLEWVQSLDDIVQDAANHRTKKVAGTVERKPVVMISNGHFWEYDPQDAAALFSITKGEGGKMKKRALSKAEQDQLRETQIKRRKLLRQRYTMVVTNVLDYIKATYPDLRVVVQTSVRCNTCEATVDTKELVGVGNQEAALLNALTKAVVARMQDPLYSFLDTTFLRLFRDSVASKRYCNNFMMPGPLDTLVHHLYGELYRLDL